MRERVCGNESGKLSERAGKGAGEGGEDRCGGRKDTHAFSAQLLRALFQLCAGIFVPVFSNNGVLL